MSPASLALALEIDGAGSHPAAWRRASGSPADVLSPRRLRTVAENAERAGFGLVTLDDSILPPGTAPDVTGRIGSVERASFVAAATRVIGVAPVAATTYAEPFHLASQLASIDHVSAGRAGWVVAADTGPAAARAWGRPAVTGHDRIRQEAADAVDVARALWDSWEDDTVIRDVASSRYLDRDRLHYIDFAGTSYSVKGPAIVPRPPQGQLVVLAPAGLVPADRVDVTLVGGTDVAAVRGAAAAAGTPRTFAELEVALDTADATGADRVADLDRRVRWPDRDRLRYVGDAAGLVTLLTELAGVVNGVRLHPLVLDEDLPELSRLVVPALTIGRVVTRPLPGTTLRVTLGLPRPANTFAGTAPRPAELTGVTR